MRTVTGLSMAVLTTAAVGHSVLSSVGAGIDRVDPFRDMKNRPQGGHGLNVLLVGTDGRDGITEEERRKYRLGGAPCHCADTIMILHLSEDRDRASIVSLPRDSYMQVPVEDGEDGEGGEKKGDEGEQRKGDAAPAAGKAGAAKGSGHRGMKLNATYAEGGPRMTLRAVESMTGVKIDHYLEVDFGSFMRTVDVVGGVEICTARHLKDSHTGLDLKPGRHELGGGEALQYVRSRHIDSDADLGRVQRQQRFMAALVKQATSSQVLLNPVKLQEVSTAVLGSVRADKELDPARVIELGRAMRSFSPSSSEFQTVPVGDRNRPVPGIGSTVTWDRPKAEKLFTALREDEPLAPPPPKRPAKKATVVAVPPSTIRVQVENGTREKGLGERLDKELRAAGFRTTGAPGNAKKPDAKHTVVQHDPRWDASARSLAAALPGAELRPVKGLGGTLRVVAGSDSPRVAPVRAEPNRDDGSEAVRGDEVTCS